MLSLQLLSLFLGTAAAAKHRIDVGKGGLVFSPNTTTAAVGDTLEFHFYPMKHSVAQSSFDKPCQSTASGGFFSGYFNVSSGQASSIFEVKVNSTDPMWLYCTAPKHCQGGMVGVVNPPKTNVSRTLDAYAAAAKGHAELSQVPASVFGGSVVSNSGGGGGDASASGMPGMSGSASMSAGPTPTQTAAAVAFVPGAGMVLAGVAAALAVL